MTQETATSQQIEDWYGLADSYMQTSTLSKAIEMMRPLAQALEQWPLVEQLNDYEVQLNFMMDYLRQGAEDPNRKEVYLQLERKLWAMLEQLGGFMEIKTACPYYDTLVKRWNGHHGAEELERILNDLSRCHSFLTNELAMAGEEEAKQQIDFHCQRQRDLFYYHLTRLSWSRDELQLMQQALKRGRLPEEELCVALSGVTISLLMYDDAFKLEWLLSAYQYSESNRIKARAMVGIIYVFSAFCYTIDHHPEMVNHLLALCDDPHFKEHLKQTILQMHCQQVTKTTQKRLTDVIIPDLVKYSGTKLNEIEENEDEEKPFDLSPNWKMEERMEKHLKELMKRTRRGEDIQYASFKNAKQHAFFHEMAHWFLPFNTLNKYVVDLYGIPQKNKNIIFRIASTGFYCASDCYSLCMLFSKLPAAIRSRLSQATLSEEIEQMNEAGYTSDTFELQMKLYMQDIYRFAQLFAPLKSLNERFDVCIPDELTEIVLSKQERTELYQQVADLLLTLKEYKEARTYFEHKILKQCEIPSALLLQEIGYCYQQLHETKTAIQWFTKADITQPNDAWTLRHLAQCYNQEGDYSQALVCYQQLESIQPDNEELMAIIAELYLKLELYDEVLPYLHKLYYLQADNVKALSGIAHCLLLLKRYNEACNYYNRVLERADFPEECLVEAGIAAGANGDLSACIRYFRTAYQRMGEEHFHSHYCKERGQMLKNSIDVCELDITCNLIMKENS